MTTTSNSIGETNLSKLLSSLRTTVAPSTYVWITIPNTAATTNIPIPLSSTIMTFHEPATPDHGPSTTLITTLETARTHKLAYQYESRMITCAVHSSLEAVGFLAVLTRVLADKGISCNPVSAYYHDHLFVPVEKVDDAVEVLKGLAGGEGEGEDGLGQ